MPTVSQQQQNLMELVTALESDPQISPEMKDLVTRGLHHVFLPEALQTKSAEAFQLAFEAIGGMPRLALWADKNPSKFFNLYARMIGPTIAPVLPSPQHTNTVWPEWLSARRLAYQESAQYAEDIRVKDKSGED
jgi:hypothetical protein